MPRQSRVNPPNAFKGFSASPEVIRLVVMMDVRFRLCLRNLAHLLF